MISRKQKPDKKTCTRVQVLLDSHLAATVYRPGGAAWWRALELELRRAVSSADWLAREHTKPSSATARSISPYAPASPSWDWAFGLPFHAHRLFLWKIGIRTRDVSGPAAPSPRSHAIFWRCDPGCHLPICRRSLELPKNTGAGRGELDVPLGAQVPALTLRPTTIRMSDHRYFVVFATAL